MAEQDSSDFKLYRYDPSMGAAVVFTALFLAASCIHSFQLFRTKAWSLVPFVIGGHSKQLTARASSSPSSLANIRRSGMDWIHRSKLVKREEDWAELILYPAGNVSP